MQVSLMSAALPLLLLEWASAHGAHLQLLSSQVLLDYCLYDTVAVQERVMGRVRLLSHLLANSSTVQVRTGHPPARPSPAEPQLQGACKASASHPQTFCSSACLPQAGQTEDSSATSRQVRIPVLGKLLGHLFFKLFRKEETSLMALDILCFLFTFLSEQKCKRSCGGRHPPCTASCPDTAACLPGSCEGPFLCLVQVAPPPQRCCHLCSCPTLSARLLMLPCS